MLQDIGICFRILVYASGYRYMLQDIGTVGVTCLYLTVDRLPTSVISVTTTENCLSFAN